MSLDIEGYETTYDLTLRYCNYDFTVSYELYSIDKLGVVDVDKYNNEITSIVSNSMTDIISTVITVSEGF